MNEAKNQPGDPMDSVHPGYETKDAAIGGVIWFAVGLVVILIVITLLVGLLLEFFNAANAQHTPPPSPLLGAVESLPPQPRLQRVPVQDLAELHQTEDKTLHSYGWIDDQAGVVHIPIERAMTLLVEREQQKGK